jgi:putative membrane protein
VALSALGAAGLIASGIDPHDRLTWLMEVAPALVAWPILHATRRSLRFTDLAYGLIALHGLILMLGAAYTYARVPLGFTLQEVFALSRNPYDKIGHFAQGFVPAIVARELLIRVFRFDRTWLLGFLVVCICLAISATYELVEWVAAVSLGQDASAFLGTQGDPWDTQADMAFALVGALAALTLGGWHDRQIARRLDCMRKGAGAG